MASSRLKIILTISILVFIAHGLEEYFTGFYDIDPIFKSVFRSFEGYLGLQMLFIFYQLALLILFFSLLYIQNSSLQLGLMIIFGIIMLFELSHIFEAVRRHSYYPGLATSFLFPVTSFYFFKELLKSFKTQG